jgi:hypothetical protein
MSQSRKYKSFGVRRTNNLSDIENPIQGLNNLLNDLPGVDPDSDITFISEDLNAIRGLKDTNIESDSFTQLAQTAPRTTVIDAEGNVILDDQGNTIQTIVDPLIRLEDRFRQFRTITENPPVFASGQGPNAFFIPSTLIPTFTKTTKIQDQLAANLSNPLVQTSDDFWILGEFAISNRFRPDFPDSFGGILWEGFYIPNPSTSTHTFIYSTSGLFHAEYDRFANGNWQVLKSIYAQKRSVLVQTTASNSLTIQLQEGETKYVSVGDFLDTDSEAIVTDISGNTVTFEKEVSVTAGQSIIFDMPIGEETTRGEYIINEILDRGEIPQIKIRILWWFPTAGTYTPKLKYLANRIVGRTYFDYFFMNQTSASPTAAPGSIRQLLESAVTPSQEVMGSSGNYRQFKTSNSTETIYVPKSALSQITKGSASIAFKQGNRSATGNFSSSDIGNIVVPTNPADLNTVVPKDIRIKDLLGSNIAATARIVNKQWPAARTAYSVQFIDHNGIIDYFVASSSTNVVTVSSTAKLRVGMLCITAATGVNDFVRITQIISGTQFRTSANLNLTNQYVFIYANSGIIDRSLDVFCVGVFGQALASAASSGSNTLQLVSATGVSNGQVVQFGSSIPTGTTVTNVSGTTITLSANIVTTISQGETVVFAPSGTSVNKEICVLPLDLSPPFIGIDVGLSTGGKNIKSSQPTFNLKVDGLEFRNTVVNAASTSESYDRLISIKNNNLSIIAKKV